MHILWTGIPNDAKNLINAKFLSRLRRLLEWQQVLCNYLENAEDDLDLIIRSTFFRMDLLPQSLTIPLMATSVENSSGPWFSFNFISPVSNDLVLFRHVRAFFYRSKGRRPWGKLCRILLHWWYITCPLQFAAYIVIIISGDRCYCFVDNDV